MLSRKRVAIAAGTLSLLLSGVSSIAGAPPAAAQVCADVTVYTTVTDPHVGQCQPLFDQWISPCYGASSETAGFGGRVEVCHPTPV